MDAALAVLDKLNAQTVEDLVRLHYEGSDELFTLMSAKKKSATLRPHLLTKHSANTSSGRGCSTLWPQ
jgi:hypothetical protein